MTKKVIIADSQFLTAQALKRMFENYSELEVSSIVSNYTELTATLKSVAVDILVTDHHLFGYENSDQLIQLKTTYPDLTLVLVSSKLLKSELSEFNKAGIQIILTKNADEAELQIAVYSMLSDKKYYSEEVLELMLKEEEPQRGVDASLNLLTQTEIEVVRLIADGLTTKEIANKKFVSFHTINTHRKNIFRKLEIKNTSELVIFAIKNGLIDNIEYQI